MTDTPDPEQLTEEEVRAANGEQLPPREQMSVIREPMPIVEAPPDFTTQPVPPDTI